MTKRAKRTLNDDTVEGEGSTEQIELVKVRIGTVGPKGQSVNGHPCKEGTVIELSPEAIDAHRAGGVPLEDVADDYDGEVYDVHVPYESPSDEQREQA